MTRSVLAALAAVALAACTEVGAAASEDNQGAYRVGNKGPFAARTDGIGFDPDNYGPGLVLNSELEQMFSSSTYVSFHEEFLGFQVINDLSDTDDVDTTGPWQSEDTATAGCPAAKADADNGAIELLLDNGSEVGDCTLFFGDELSIDSDTEPFCVFRIQYQTAPAAADSLSWGFASAQNDIQESIANHAMFSVTGADNNLDTESDDGTTDRAANDTEVDMVAGTYIETLISMNSMHGRTALDPDGASATDVHFFYRTSTGGAWTQVNTSTTFTVGANIALQPYVQVEKTSGTTVPDLLVDYISCAWKREND
jgi:hypothetical protein